MSFEAVFFVIFLGFAAYFAYSMWRHGGFKGAMFGAEIVSSVGEVSSMKRGLISQKLEIHLLRSDDPGTQSIGLELKSSAPGAWSRTPINLSGSEVRKLISLLEQALATTPRTL